MHIGELVKVYRKKHKLTQTDFAKKSGLSRQTVTRIEISENEKDISVNEKTLLGIATGLDMSYTQLINLMHGDQPNGEIEISKEEVIPIMDSTNSKKVSWLFIAGYNDCFSFYPEYPNVSKLYIVQRSDKFTMGNHVAVEFNGRIRTAHYFNIKGQEIFVGDDDEELKGDVKPLGHIISEINALYD